MKKILDKDNLSTIILKVQIKPDKDQINLLNSTALSYIQACNYVSERAFKHNIFKYVALNKLYYYTIRELFNLKSQLACSVFKTVESKYASKASQNNSKNKQNKDNTKNKDKNNTKNKDKNKYKPLKPIQFKVPEYDLVYKGDYTIYKDYININVNIPGAKFSRIKVPYIPNHYEHYFDSLLNKENIYKFGTAKFKSIKIGNKIKYYLYIPVTTEIKEPAIDKNSDVLGIDRGIRFTAVSYNSNKHTDYYSGKKEKNKRANFKRRRRELQKKGLRHPEGD